MWRLSPMTANSPSVSSSAFPTTVRSRVVRSPDALGGAVMVNENSVGPPSSGCQVVVTVFSAPGTTPMSCPSNDAALGSWSLATRVKSSVPGELTVYVRVPLPSVSNWACTPVVLVPKGLRTSSGAPGEEPRDFRSSSAASTTSCTSGAKLSRSSGAPLRVTETV